MAPLSRVLSGTVLLGALVASQAAAGSSASHPEGWRVRVDSQAIAQRQGVYQFQVRVHDAEGRPVDNAEVTLRVPGPGRTYEVPARRVKAGWYSGVGHLTPGIHNPRGVRAVVRAR